MTQKDKDLLTISDILNDDKTFDRIANKLRLRINSDDMCFHDIEEDILKNFKRMNKELKQKYNDTI